MVSLTVLALLLVSTVAFFSFYCGSLAVVLTHLPMSLHSQGWHFRFFSHLSLPQHLLSFWGFFHSLTQPLFLCLPFMQVWSEVLKAVPNSRLLMKCKPFSSARAVANVSQYLLYLSWLLVLCLFFCIIACVHRSSSHTNSIIHTMSDRAHIF